jgi:hypothetical protein
MTLAQNRTRAPESAVDAGLVRAAASSSTSQQDVDAAANFAVDQVIRTDAGWRTGADMTMMIMHNSHLVICGEGILYRFLLALQPVEEMSTWPERFAPWEEPIVLLV